jgi:hypothetical protein
MADDHVAVPPKGERSIINRKNKEHQTNCAGWINNKNPWNCNAHHILPVTCFNPIQVDPASKVFYVIRCVLVSKWNINGGNKFPTQGRKNNMVSLPLSSAYNNTYPALKNLSGPFKKPVHPINECMHNSGISEHYLYIKEVRTYLENNVWNKLQEDKEKHKGKGKPIKDELETAVEHFRDELEKRGNRKTKAGNKGTVDCWRAQKSDKGWMRTFSMASNAMTQHEP